MRCAKDAPIGTIILAVEPVSVNYDLLLANVLVNGLKGIVHPIKAAIAPKQGFLDLEWVSCREKVEAVTMKEILDLLSKLGYDRVDLLKIDIEGAELDLLTKENSWLSKVNAIVAEIHPQVYGLRGVDEIVTALKSSGSTS